MSEGKYAIVFNGPPNSGKDTAAQLVLAAAHPSHHLEFKTKLLEITACLFNVSLDELLSLYNNRDTKEVETCRLEGYSPRGAVKFVAETVMKPNFGSHYFAYSAALKMVYGLNVFSDGGFISEIESVYDECDGQMMIVQIHRPGCDFQNDTRSYIDQYKDALVVKLHNDSDMSILRSRVINLINQFLTHIEERKAH